MGDKVKKHAYMLPQQDEFVSVDVYGTDISGAYDKDGFFMVNIEERGMKGRCDEAGYLLARNGKRAVNLQMKERIRKRSYQSQQPDELYKILDNGEKICGQYNEQGYFIVDESDR